MYNCELAGRFVIHLHCDGLEKWNLEVRRDIGEIHEINMEAALLFLRQRPN